MQTNPELQDVLRLQYFIIQMKAAKNLTHLAASSAFTPDELHAIGEAFWLRAKAHRRDIRQGALTYRRPDADQFSGQSLIRLDVDAAAMSWGFRMHLLVHARTAMAMARSAARSIHKSTPRMVAMRALLEATRDEYLASGMRPAIDSTTAACEYLADQVTPNPLEMDVIGTKSLVLDDLFTENDTLDSPED